MKTIEIKTDLSGEELQVLIWELEAFCECKLLPKPVLRQTNVSGLLPLDKIEGSLNKNKQYTIWHDGGEWLISLKGKEQENCKTLNEWVSGNDR